MLSSGEQVTCSLLAGALIKLDIDAKSWLNWQIPIITEGEHANSRIINMNVETIDKLLLHSKDKNNNSNEKSVKI